MKRPITLSSALAIAGLAVSGCAASHAASTGPPQAAGVDQSSPAAGTPFAYKLYTHCGIHFANINGTWFEADTPLSDGSGNPPKGWDNPEQRGVMRFLTATSAEFRGDNGQDVKFHVMPAPQQPPECA